MSSIDLGHLEKVITRAAIESAIEHICREYIQLGQQLCASEQELLESDRRDGLRHSVRIPFFLYPVIFVDGEWRSATQPLVAVTTNISTHGIGFCYDTRLRSRYAVAEFDCGSDEPVRLFLEVRWEQKKGRRAFLAGAVALSNPEFAEHEPAEPIQAHS